MLQDYTYEEQESGRTDTLIQALEKIERLEKQLNIVAQHHKKAVEALAKMEWLNDC